jgi:hypothetical protein
MKKSIVISMLLMAGALSLSADDIEKGKIDYMKTLKIKCAMSGLSMASKHTQNEWEDYKNEGKLIEELVGLCPKGEAIIKNESFQEKKLPGIYLFMFEYASDSGKVPGC